MESKLAEKIERLEAQLPRWEKWLFAAYGAAITMLANSICRVFESSYLFDAFFRSLHKVDFKSPAFPGGGTPTIFPPITDLVALNIQKALFAPYWHILGYILLLLIFVPGALLAVQPVWRKVSLHKRFNLIFGYIFSDWLILLSLGILDPSNYIALAVISAPALGLGYWWLRRKKDKAEEVFP